MDIHLPHSFVTPLQHIFAAWIQRLAGIPTINDPGMLYTIIGALTRSLSFYEKKYGDLTKQDKGFLSRVLHNSCLCILNRMLAKGTLGGAALCEVTPLGDNQFEILLLGSRTRTWRGNIRDQKWELKNRFLFTIREPSP